jgi:hypothetical protein
MERRGETSKELQITHFYTQNVIVNYLEANESSRQYWIMFIKSSNFFGNSIQIASR